MVTADEIRAITHLRRPRRQARANDSHASRPTSASSRASTRPKRAASGRCSPSSTGASRRPETSTASSAWSASDVPGDIFGEVPISLGTVFPVGFRAAASRTRVMRIEPQDYHAVAAARARGRAGGRQAGEPPHERRARPAGTRRGAAAAARDRRRAALGRAVHGAAPLPRPQPDPLHLGQARRRPTRPSSWGGALPADAATCR